MHRPNPAGPIAWPPASASASVGGEGAALESRPGAAGRVAVIVLGDVGRSPRMQYHALALADDGAIVELIGLAGSEPLAALRDHPRVRLRLIDGDPPGDGTRAGYLAHAAARMTRQAAALWRVLLAPAEPLDVILVQTPPALPTLAVAGLAARRCRARLVIDWHNFGYAMLALRLGRAHPLVRLAAVAERALGRRADAHLCVSQAMRRELAERWSITATTLYDRPAARFTPLPEAARDAAARALCTRAGVPVGTERPALIVSATSWTADEDFELLLDAVERCEARFAAAGPARSTPAALIAISGDGPRRAAYAARFAARPDAAAIRLATLWLPADEYPRFLAAADLGLCLHRSASGVDLPMKIADMLGAALPVAALDYGPCLREILGDDDAALFFADAAQLAEQLWGLCGGLPADRTALDRLRAAGAAQAPRQRWQDGWRIEARPLLAPRTAPR